MPLNSSNPLSCLTHPYLPLSPHFPTSINHIFKFPNLFPFPQLMTMISSFPYGELWGSVIPTMGFRFTELYHSGVWSEKRFYLRSLSLVYAFLCPKGKGPQDIFQRTLNTTHTSYNFQLRLLSLFHKYFTTHWH